MHEVRRPPAVLVLAALATVYVVWGSTYLAIRVAVETLPPFLMAATRFLVAGGLLFAWVWWRRGRVRPPAAHWGGAFAVGGLLLFGGNGMVVWAEQHVTSSLAALLVATVPLWMVAIGRVAFGERLAPRALAGVGLGFAGVALLVDVGSGRGTLLGTLAVLLAALSWASGSLYSRRASLPDDPLQATAMQMLAGGVLLAVAGVITGEPARLDLAAASAASLAAVAYLIVFGSLLAFTAYVWLLRAASTSLVSTYAYVNPVVAVLLGWAILGEPVTTRMLLAGGIVVAGVALIVSAPRRPAVAAPPAPTPEPIAGSGSGPGQPAACGRTG